MLLFESFKNIDGSIDVDLSNKGLTRLTLKFSKVTEILTSFILFSVTYNLKLSVNYSMLLYPILPASFNLIDITKIRIKLNE